MMEISKSDKFKKLMIEVSKRSLQIPFGNSKWQIDSIVNEAKTSERAYRALLLNFTTKLNDLKTAERKRRKDVLKIKLLQEKIKKEKNKLERELLEIDIEEIESGFEYTNKLALDCVEELNYMWSFIEKLPKYTREEFEAGEIEHFKKRGVPALDASFLDSIKNKQLQNSAKGEIE
jgi:hypothetical protein